MSSTRSILDSEEAQLRLLLDNLRRDYERAAEPYLDRLAEIARLRPPQISWRVNPFSQSPHCFHDGALPDTVTGISCPCPKCSATA